MKKILIATITTFLLVSSLIATAYADGTDQQTFDLSGYNDDVLLQMFEQIQSELESRGVMGSHVEEESKESNVPKGEFDEETVISQLETRELHYNDIWDHDFLIVKNNSEFDLDLSLNVLYYDENNQIIGTTSREQKAVESGYPIVFWFMPDDKYARVEYILSAEEDDWYEPVLSDLSYEANITDSKVILSVTNSGDEPADFVEGTVIFFSNGNPVGFDWTYFTDNDSELKPGNTIIKELNCYDSFDSYEVYFTGRR